MDIYKAIKSGIGESLYVDVDPEMANRDRIQELKERYEKLANIPKKYKSAKNEDPLYMIVIVAPLISHHLEIAHYNFIKAMDLMQDSDILDSLQKNNSEEIKNMVSQEMIMLALYNLKRELDFIEEKLDELETGLQDAYEF